LFRPISIRPEVLGPKTTASRPLLIAAGLGTPVLGASQFDRFQLRARGEPVGLARRFPCLPLSPNLRAFTAVRLSGAADRTSALHLSAVTGRFKADSVACPPPVTSFRPARLFLIGQRVNADAAIGQTSRLSSAFFPFSVFQPSPQSFWRRPAFRSSRFSVCLRSCGVGRHSSSPAADVVRACDRGWGHRSCVTGLFLGGVPLSAPHSFGLTDHSRAPVNEGE
jgi:hypothetical protein